MLVNCATNLNVESTAAPGAAVVNLQGHREKTRFRRLLKGVEEILDNTPSKDGAKREMLGMVRGFVQASSVERVSVKKLVDAWCGKKKTVDRRVEALALLVSLIAAEEIAADFVPFGTPDLRDKHVWLSASQRSEVG
jgi:hypothetical protein